MEEQREYSFEFSVVMAVYNVEPFLREAVSSLIAQNLGFKKIQLIMVDDGSTDGSGAICDEYAKKYPNNVIAIHKENGGVSSARNEGLKYVRGRYVNFLDSDDKLSKNTMSRVRKFFQKHEQETDIVAIPIFFFDGKRGQHILNSKFEKQNRVIDLIKEPTAIQLSISSTFTKSEVFLGHLFDQNLLYTEDGKLLLTLHLEGKAKLGVLSGPKYWYRKRTEGEHSAIQDSRNRKEYYAAWTKHYCKEVLETCIKRFGYVPKFVQFAIMYDVKERIKQKDIPYGLLADREREDYLTGLCNILQHIDDDVILAQKDMHSECKAWALEKKYGQALELTDRYGDAVLRHQNTVLFTLSRCRTCFEFLEINAGKCQLEGYTVVFPASIQTVGVQLEINGKSYPCMPVERESATCALDEPISWRYGFRVEFPLCKEEEKYCIRTLVFVNGMRVEHRNIIGGRFFPVSDKYRNAYYIKDGWRVSFSKKQVVIASCGRWEHLKSERLFLKELWKKDELGGRKAVFGRLIYHGLQLLKKKPIWLISDRLFKADDNGEAFFLYLQNFHRKEISPYYIISKSSADYKRMGKIGATVNAHSWLHKILHLLCDYNISSQADNGTINPFSGYDEGYRDILAKTRFIFLQHGVIQNELKWLSRFSKNISGFVTSALPEYNFIKNGNFYSEKEMWLTGLPRFDRLYHNEQRYVTIMPTWRRYLLVDLDQRTKIWKLSKGFTESAYFKFYNALLNSEELLKTARKYNYRIRFLPHPTIQPHVSIFSKNDAVEFLDVSSSYREIYAESDLVVTDYSSAVFDFAYLRKPIIYCHFDENEFFAGEHVCTRGYFEHERDGFGEVEYDLESTVNRIIEYMESGCVLKDKYRERIDSFFAFNDQNSCQRVYEKILELEKQE